MSKFDELKAYHVPAEIAGGVVLAEAFDYYEKKPVDAAIAELKDENKRLKEQMPRYKQYEEREKFLKTLVDEYEGYVYDWKGKAFIATPYINIFIKGILRALWLARVERAKARKDYWYARSCHEGDKRLWSIDGSPVKYIGCIKRTNFDWLKIWNEVECKCLKKAEEYK